MLFSHQLKVFKETEWRKTITVPIVNDNQYESDMDFYLILKNPEGGAGLGDPSVTRVTIIDDDGKSMCVCLVFVCLSLYVCWSVCLAVFLSVVCLIYSNML